MTVPKPGPPRNPLGDPQRDPQPRPADPRQAVERAMSALDGLADRPLAEHVEVFEQVHAALGEALASPAGRA